MYIKLDFNGETPIFEQLKLQIMFAIAQGAIGANEPIPSTRELALELAVNANTVMRTYRILSEEGILLANRGQGYTVSESAPELCRRAREEYFRDLFRKFLEKARQSDLSPEYIKTFIMSELEQI